MAFLSLTDPFFFENLNGFAVNFTLQRNINATKFHFHILLTHSNEIEKFFFIDLYTDYFISPKYNYIILESKKLPKSLIISLN
jgi:hypothetical protein